MTTDDEGTRSVDILDITDTAADGEPDLLVGNSGSMSRIYYNSGVHVVTLRITDNTGASSEMTVTIEGQSQ